MLATSLSELLRLGDVPGARSTASSQPRAQLRVFVSSTFRDMQPERERLVRHGYPRLRRFATERGVQLSLIDLRWGITREQAEAGSVVPICLREVERCRPYFIALLGGRYGWVPSAIDETTLREFDWVGRHPGVSLTELEIRLGSLNDRSRNDYVRFYFRSPEYTERLVREDPTLSENEAALAKLDALKAEIRAGGFTVLDGYHSSTEVVERICSELEARIESEFPLDAALASNGRRAVHQVVLGQGGKTKGIPIRMFQRARTESDLVRRRVQTPFVDRDDVLARLDRFADGGGSFLGLWGAAGSGKTALVVTFAKRRLKREPCVLTHHFPANGGTLNSALEQLAYELDEFYGQGHGPFDGLRATMPVAETLARASRHGGALLVIDELSSPLGTDEPLQALPSGVRIVCTASTLDTLRAVAPPGATFEELRGLERDGQRAFITAQLDRHGKALSESQLAQLVGPDERSPLELLTAVEELRMFGRFERLDEAIAAIAGARTYEEVYEQVLARSEQDLTEGSRNLVAEAFSLLSVARERTLGETELETALGLDPLPWASLYDGIRDLVVSKNRGLTFRDAALAGVAERRYVAAPDECRRAHRTLAAYFLVSPDRWRRTELPHHLAEAGDWEALRACLLRLDLATDLKEKDWSRYWTALEDRYDVDAEHRRALAGLDEAKDETLPSWKVGVLGQWLLRTGAKSAAEEALRRSVSAGSAGARVRSDLALLLMEQSRLDEAAVLLEGPVEEHEAAVIQLTRAVFEERRGKLVLAEELYRETLATADAQGFGLGIQQPLVTASVLAKLTRFDIAAGRLDEAESFARRAITLDASTRGVLADVLWSRADRLDGSRLEDRIRLLREARDCFSAEERENRSLPVVLADLGWSLLCAGADVAEATEAIERALALSAMWTECDPFLAKLHLDLAFCRLAAGRADAALELLRKALDSYRDIPGTWENERATILAGMGSANFKRGEHAESEACLVEALEIFRRLDPEHSFIAGTLRSLGKVYAATGRQQAAEQATDEAARIEAAALSRCAARP